MSEWSDGYSAGYDRRSEEVHALHGRCDAAERECDQLRGLLSLAIETLEKLTDIHAEVRMDTDEDRELHARVVADFRQHIQTLRDESGLLKEQTHG